MVNVWCFGANASAPGTICSNTLYFRIVFLRHGFWFTNETLSYVVFDARLLKSFVFLRRGDQSDMKLMEIRT